MSLVDSKSPSRQQAIDKVAKTVGTILHDADPTEVQRAEALLRALGESASMLSPEGFRRHAYLAERPTILTKKEFGDLLTRWREEPAVLDTWVGRHSLAVGHRAAEVYRALFRAALRHAHRCMDVAASSPEQTTLVAQVSTATACWRLVQTLWECGDLGQRQGAFEEALDGAYRWAHFRNHETYVGLRELETQVVLDFACGLRGERAVEAYKLVLPSRHTWETARGQQAIVLRDEVRAVLADAIVGRALEMFKTPGGLRQVFRNEDLQGLQHVVLNSEGPLWNGAGREQVLALICDEGGSSALRRNLTAFLHLHEDDRVRLEGSAWATANQIDALFRDRVVIEAMWRQVLAAEVNPRFRTSLVDLAQHLNEHAGQSLCVPDWWDEAASAHG